MAPKRWQDWTIAVLGLWMMAPPSVLGFSMVENSAMRVTWFLGLAIVVFAGIAVYMPKIWEEAINIILGICLIASPWSFGYIHQTTPAAANAMVVGLLVVVLAVWAMLRDAALQQWWHEHHLIR
jgi:hypothetical protein